VSGGVIDESTEWKSTPNNSNYANSKYYAELEVWRGIAEGLNAVIVNPGIIIGPGNWKTDSSAIFNKVWRGLSFYTSGVNGFVGVEDVSRAILMLMQKEIFGKRYIVVGQNLPYKEVFDMIADELNRKRPSMYAGAFLSGVAVKMEAIRGIISGNPPLITRETAISAQSKHFYSSEKIKMELEFVFSDIDSEIRKTSDIFLKDHGIARRDGV
jgi:nucleoside-diphosphate-sugar epimerase